LPLEQFIRVKIFVAFAALIVVGICTALALVVRRMRRRPATRIEGAFLLSLLMFGVVGAAAVAYMFVIEPDWVEVTNHEVRTDRIPEGRHVRIVHITDLHVDDLTPLLSELPEKIAALHPDFVVFTGDAINEKDGLPRFRTLLSNIHPPGGVFAVRGNHDVDSGWGGSLFGGTGAIELTGTPVQRARGSVSFCGAPYGDAAGLEECLRNTPTGFRVALYHSPDLVEAIQPEAPDLYLAGHTHGGQLRIPWFGAVITNSTFDKKYEMGLFQVGRTALYVNRGIGTDGGPIRARFLCRPEIAVFDVIGTGSLEAESGKVRTASDG